MTAPKKTYLYARVSTKEQIAENQVPELKKWAEGNDPDAVLLDPDYGTGRNMARPSMDFLVKEIKADRVKTVVVVSISRIARRVSLITRFVELCLDHKVSLYVIREKTDIATSYGRMIIQIFGMVAELENEMRSENTKAGWARHKKECDGLGVPYKNPAIAKGGSIKVTEAKQDAILHLKEKGHSYREIAAIVGLSDKTVSRIIKSPRQAFFVTTKEKEEALAKLVG